MTRTYRTAADFKQSLEQRLRTASTSGFDLARRRQLVVFDRFLARIALELGEAVILKGGLAVELRLERARSTTDVDLRVMGSPEGMLLRLDDATRRDLGDFMVFAIRPHPRHPQIQNAGLPYDGVRYRVECTLAGKIYARPFGVDVAFGDPILGEPELLVAADTLAFAGIAPPTLRVYPVETHIAEKLHAYTMPRARPNSRVKDLPDIALLASAGAHDSARLREAIHQTFDFRSTHSPPTHLPSPPDTWDRPYASIAREDQLQWPTLDAVFDAARAFLDPVLAGSMNGHWEPESWTWTSRPA